MSLSTITQPARDARACLSGHLKLLRLDHSVKQIFVIPGIVVAASLTGASLDRAFVLRILLGMTGVVCVTSSNYVLNEILDAPFDRLHPTKHLRPAACRSVNIPLAYAQWVVCALVGFGLALSVSKMQLMSVFGLWAMGCLYNIPPIRTKDVLYLDVLSESINNPIRLLVGWYIVTSSVIPPISLLIAYWMLGAYFMALKRFSEYRQIGRDSAMKYRRSFEFYTERSLLTSVLFYAATAMLFFGAFMMRYREEMVLAFPFIALLMADYFKLSFVEDSPVQNPEKLYREPRIMALLVLCSIVLTVTLYVKMPWLERAFPKSGVYYPVHPHVALSVHSGSQAA